MIFKVYGITTKMTQLLKLLKMIFRILGNPLLIIIKMMSRLKIKIVLMGGVKLDFKRPIMLKKFKKLKLKKILKFKSKLLLLKSCLTLTI
jgi:hypothetical protein